MINLKPHGLNPGLGDRRPSNPSFDLILLGIAKCGAAYSYLSRIERPIQVRACCDGREGKLLKCLGTNLAANADQRLE